MKNSQVTKIGMIAVGVLFVAWLILTLATSDRGGRQTESAIKDDNRCPDCGRELPKGALGECPYCKLDEGGRKKNARNTSLAASPVIPIILVCVFCLLLAI